MKLWPTQWGKESNPLTHLQHRLRLRRGPPGGEPKTQRTELSQETCCKQIQVNVIIKTRLQVKGQLVSNVSSNLLCQVFQEEVLKLNTTIPKRDESNPSSISFSLLCGQLSGRCNIPLIYICRKQEIKDKGLMHHVPKRQRSKDPVQDQSVKEAGQDTCMEMW